MSEREQRAATPGAEARISKDKCLHAGRAILNPNGVFCEACGAKLVWVQAAQMMQAENSLSPASSSQAPGVTGSLEDRVAEWIRTRIGAENAHPRERAMRLLEEAVELAQSEGVTEEQALKQTRYVFSRPIGDPYREAGGVAVCLLGWCAARGETLLGVATAEVERIEAKPVDQIRGSLARKQDQDLVVATPVQECGASQLRDKCDLLEKQNASLAALLKSREDVSQWVLSQPDADCSKGVLEGVKGLVERLRANVKRLEDLCHRWNKMAAHFAAGSEFVNDPERVLEALKSRQEMAERLREKRREQFEAAEQSLAAYEALDAEIQQLNGSARIGVPNVHALVSLLRREYASAIGGTTQDMQGMIQELAAHAMSAKRLKAQLTAAQEELRVERERFEHLAGCINTWGHFWRYVDDFVPNRQTSQRTASIEEWRINVDAARSQKGGPDHD